MTNVTNIESNETINLSETIQDYLSLIYVMERDNEPVIGSRLAELLGVKPPTVTATLKRMVRDELITMDDNGTHLTDKGWAASRVVMRRHMLMEWMMSNTLPWSRLHSEAHHLEHAISAMAESALMEQLGRPQTCPHGNPIPPGECCDRSARSVPRQVKPLAELAIGASGRIAWVYARSDAQLHALDSLQLRPGAMVTLHQRRPSFVVECEGAHLALDDALATAVNVWAADPPSAAADADAAGRGGPHRGRNGGPRGGHGQRGRGWRRT